MNLMSRQFLVFIIASCFTLSCSHASEQSSTDKLITQVSAKLDALDDNTELSPFMRQRCIDDRFAGQPANSYTEEDVDAVVEITGSLDQPTSTLQLWNAKLLTI